MQFLLTWGRVFSFPYSELKNLYNHCSSWKRITAITHLKNRKEEHSETVTAGTSLAVQWLGLHTSTEGGTVSIPGLGAKIPHATWRSQKKKKKEKKK